MDKEENNKVISILLKEIERLENKNKPLEEAVERLNNTKEYLKDELEKARHKIFILENEKEGEEKNE